MRNSWSIVNIGAGDNPIAQGSDARFHSSSSMSEQVIVELWLAILRCSVSLPSISISTAVQGRGTSPRSCCANRSGVAGSVGGCPNRSPVTVFSYEMWPGRERLGTLRHPVGSSGFSSPANELLSLGLRVVGASSVALHCSNTVSSILTTVMLVVGGRSRLSTSNSGNRSELTRAPALTSSPDWSLSKLTLRHRLTTAAARSEQTPSKHPKKRPTTIMKVGTASSSRLWLEASRRSACVGSSQLVDSAGAVMVGAGDASDTRD